MAEYLVVSPEGVAHPVVAHTPHGALTAVFDRLALGSDVYPPHTRARLFNQWIVKPQGQDSPRWLFVA